jgi:hypothetical protein
MLPSKFQFIWQRGFRGKKLICEKLTDDEREVIGRGVRGSHKNASPRLSSTSCSFVDRISKLSINHRKDTALDLKKIKQISHFFL